MEAGQGGAAVTLVLFTQSPQALRLVQKEALGSAPRVASPFSKAAAEKARREPGHGLGAKGRIQERRIWSGVERRTQAPLSSPAPQLVPSEFGMDGQMRGADTMAGTLEVRGRLPGHPPARPCQWAVPLLPDGNAVTGADLLGVLEEPGGTGDDAAGQPGGENGTGVG